MASEAKVPQQVYTCTQARDEHRVYLEHAVRGYVRAIARIHTHPAATARSCCATRARIAIAKANSVFQV